MHSAGFEPATLGFEDRCSIQLSYKCVTGSVTDAACRSIRTRPSLAVRLAGRSRRCGIAGRCPPSISSAHLLSNIEFAHAARAWSEDAMIDPLWWRTWENRCREEEFPPVPVIAEIPDDVQAYLALKREC